MSDKKIVVTGIGLVTPLGSDLKVFWERLTGGKSGIRKIDKFDASGLTAQIAGQVAEFNVDDFLPAKMQRRMDPFVHYAVASARMAVQDSGLELSKQDVTRVGVIVGSGIGGLTTLEKNHGTVLSKGPSRCSPFMIPQMIANMGAGHVGIDLGVKGPNYSTVSACASGLHAVGDGMRCIQYGDADIMIVGGAEAAVCLTGCAGFCALKALSTRNDEPERASRPFDLNRNGFVMGEGAAMVVLEREESAKQRGAEIYCEVAGFGSTCDAYHMTAPAPGGEGAARAMTLALEDSGAVPEDVQYINAHGTSTQMNDKEETAAIKTAFGPDLSKKLAVSSTKSMTGHLLGAAGGLETAVCAMVLKHGVVPPTINYETPDPDCDLDYVPNTARELSVKACLNNSLGFGGHNISLLMRAL